MGGPAGSDFGGERQVLPLQTSHRDKDRAALNVFFRNPLTGAATEKAPGEGPGLGPPGQQDQDSGWEPLATPARHPGGLAQPLGHLAAPTSAPTEF